MENTIILGVLRIYLIRIKLYKNIHEIIGNIYRPNSAAKANIGKVIVGLIN